jgi:hypothetical protein
MMGRWEVEIPGFRPISLNVLLRTHWAKRTGLAASTLLIVGYHLKSAGVPKAAGRRRVGMRITLAGRDKPLDDDNAWKLVLDTCVATRVLVDDRREYVERTPVEYDRGPHRKTVIILEDIP